MRCNIAAAYAFVIVSALKLKKPLTALKPVVYIAFMLLQPVPHWRNW